jgi:hypothetical protein
VNPRLEDIDTRAPWPSFRRLGGSVLLAATLLQGCGGGAGTSTAISTADSTSSVVSTTIAADSSTRRAQALAVWREPSPALRAKGSCVGCHGPDFLDLARIGSSPATIIRRATVDGATAAEAQVLADSIADLRTQYAIAAENPQTFRPFQPGGALLPGDTSQARDIAFGHQLQRLAPTLMGPRIATLAQAKQARDELIDLARGSNAAGANASRLNLRSLPVGIAFPQWSADAFNATGSDVSQTTLNDWISDVAFEPIDADRPQWLALQQAYLADPSSANFWTLFAFVDRLTLQPAAHMASLTDKQRGYVQGYADAKYRATLIGQQLLRTGLNGTTASFVGDGAVAFNYLLADNHGVKLADGYVMPQSRLWDVADVGARSVLQASISTPANAPLPDALAELGFPKFVQDSTRSPTTGLSSNRWDTGTEMRLAWFWLGLTMDPSLFRLGRGGATQGGEYVNATLANNTYNLYLHDQFSQVMRAIARTLPETGFNQNFVAGSVPQASEFYMGYYLIQYHPNGNGIVRDDWVTPEQKQLYTTMVNNTHRMYLLLYADVLSRSTANKISQNDFTNFTGRMRTVFTAYEPQSQAADEALIQRVKSLGSFQ